MKKLLIIIGSLSLIILNSSLIISCGIYNSKKEENISFNAIWFEDSDIKKHTINIKDIKDIKLQTEGLFKDYAIIYMSEYEDIDFYIINKETFLKFKFNEKNKQWIFKGE